MEQLRVAIVGYGGIGSYHATTLMKGEPIEVVGVYDPKENRRQVAQEHGFAVYENLSAVLADEQVEVVLIATPNDSHCSLAIQSMQAGKHVICEKPVAMSVKELDEMLAVAKATGQTFMVHQNRRWDPDFLIIRDLYQNKQIGELFQIESRVQGANGIPGDWRHLPEHGGGMLLDWGVHLLDQLLWLVDSPIKTKMVDFSYVLGDQVDDGFIAYLTFENGVKALIEVGTTNYTTLPRWYVKGYEGTARIENWNCEGEMVRATHATDVAAPTPIQAGVGLTKTMAPPSEEATETVALPTVSAPAISYYQNVYEVIRHQATPIVKNEEVRQVLVLIEELFELGKQK